MKSLASIFPRASKSFHDANLELAVRKARKQVGSPMPFKIKQNAVQGNVVAGNGKRGVMNATEAEFALMLEGQERAGEILRYDYEGITLRWNGVQYTPDFIVFPRLADLSRAAFDWKIRLIEVKGVFTGGKFERAIERFRHARTYWPQFSFELHQKTKNGWKQKY